MPQGVKVRVLSWAPAVNSPVFAADSLPPFNHFRFRLGPDVVIGLGAKIKQAGETMMGEQAELNLLHQPREEMAAYERLIGDAMIGDATLFARQDSAEAQWRIVDPVTRGQAPVQIYEPDTWGPGAAAGIAANVGGWHDPLPSVPPGKLE